jgi:hypothetical protein
MAAHDRIRLTGLLRKSPAPAGLFYCAGPVEAGVRPPRAASPARRDVDLEELARREPEHSGHEHVREPGSACCRSGRCCCRSGARGLDLAVDLRELGLQAQEVLGRSQRRVGLAEGRARRRAPRSGATPPAAPRQGPRRRRRARAPASPRSGVARSCSAYPLTVSTRLGTRSWRPLSWTSIPLHASSTLVRAATSEL